MTYTTGGARRNEINVRERDSSPSSGVVLQRCDLEGFVWELYGLCFKYVKFNVL